MTQQDLDELAQTNPEEFLELLATILENDNDDTTT